MKRPVVSAPCKEGAKADWICSFRLRPATAMRCGGLRSFGSLCTGSSSRSRRSARASEGRARACLRYLRMAFTAKCWPAPSRLTGWVSLLLVLFLYICAIFTTMQIGQNHADFDESTSIFHTATDRSRILYFEFWAYGSALL